MKFADFINVAAIKADLAADDKPAAIRELVVALSTAGAIAEKDIEGIVGAIMKREELGSTGIGRGVAVPHTKHASVERLVGTVGVSVEGVDFNSLDGDKVQLASRPSGRSLACAGKYLPPAPRRNFLSLFEAGPHC
jgi:nitrogen PTS system EIIA component